MTYKKIIQVIDYDTGETIYEVEPKNEADFIKIMQKWSGETFIEIANEKLVQRMQSFMSLETYSSKLNKTITKEIFMIWYHKYE